MPSTRRAVAGQPHPLVCAAGFERPSEAGNAAKLRFRDHADAGELNPAAIAQTVKRLFIKLSRKYCGKNGASLSTSNVIWVRGFLQSDQTSV